MVKCYKCEKDINGNDIVRLYDDHLYCEKCYYENTTKCICSSCGILLTNTGVAFHFWYTSTICHKCFLKKDVPIM